MALSEEDINSSFPRPNVGLEKLPSSKELIAQLPMQKVELEKLQLEIRDLKWKVRWVSRSASAVLGLLAIAGFLWNLYQFREQQQVTAKKESEARDREFRKAVWDRQLGMYYELSELTAAIAALPADDENRKKAENRFLVLYSGPLKWST